MTEATKTPQERIDELEHVIDNTREEFNEKILSLKTELSNLRESIQTEQNTSFEKKAEISLSYTIKQNSSPVKLSSEPHVQTQPVEARLKENSEANLKESAEVDKNKWKESPAAASSGWDDDVNKNTAEPGYLSVFLSKFFLTILYFILSRLSVFISPFQSLFHKLIKLYHHYKDQGKAPVFLMTVAGLLTLTVGFGYLLQYSFHILFNDTLKAITGFIIGIGIIGAGALLANKRTDFREYAASVVALGVIFNFLTAYFVGPYYGLVSETSGFLLLMAVTLVSFALALIYETRVVSFVTLVGGVFMPLIIGDVNSLGLVFVLYLFILSCGNLYLAYKIKWPALSHITFVLSLSVIEYIGISKEISPLITMALLTGFFYMYTYNWSFQGIKIKEKLSRYDLTLLVSNIFYFIYAMLQVPANSTIVANILLLHAVLLGLVVFGLQLLKTVLAPVYLLMIGLLVTTSVFVLAPVDVTSVIWAIEGLVLIYIGFQYKHKLIRAEGYAIYIIAMLGLLWHLGINFSAISTNVMSWYWVNLLAFGTLSFSAYRLIARFHESADQLEKKAAFMQNEIFTLWGAASISLVLAVFVPELMPVLLVIPMSWCFYRVSKFRLRLAQIIGFYFLLSLFVQVLTGMLNANTTVIMQQSLISWIVIAKLLFFTWALHFYYQYFDLQGAGKKMAMILHKSVFYVPVGLLVLSLIQISMQNIAEQKQMEFGYLWLDFIIIGALLLTGRWLLNKENSLQDNELSLRHKYILSETGSLYLTVFFLYTVAILFQEWMFNAAAIPLLFLLHRSVKEKLPLTEKLAWAHFLLFAVMTWLSYQTVGNLHFSEQSWSTQIAWGELLLCAWAMQMVYERSGSKEGTYDLAVKLRIAVYLLIPLLFLPRALRLYAEYLPVFIWASFAISWFMYKKLKIETLLKQLTVLFFVAVITTVLMALNAISGTQQLPGLAALITGVIVISFFHYIEKTIHQKSQNLTLYKSIQLSSPYFYAFALAAFTYALTNLVTLSLLITAVFFLLSIQGKKVRVVMRETIRVAYLLIWAGFVSVLVLVYLQAETSYLVVIIDLIALAGLWYITHRREAILLIMQRRHMAQNVQFWFFHALVFITYSGVLNLAFEAWSVGTSIVMLMHAVLVLFLTLSDEYKGLLRLSIALYGLTAAKVLFHDMNDFSHIHKVIALMCMGSILMLAAYVFQKVRNNRVISTC